MLFITNFCDVEALDAIQDDHDTDLGNEASPQFFGIFTDLEKAIEKTKAAAEAEYLTPWDDEEGQDTVRPTIVWSTEGMRTPQAGRSFQELVGADSVTRETLILVVIQGVEVL